MIRTISRFALITAAVALLVAGFAGAAPKASTTVVISHAYGGGGATSGTPTYNKDYVELFNLGASPQSLVGWSLQYGSATGQFGSTAGNIFAFPAGTSIPAGGYLLVELGSLGTVGAPITPTPDFSTTNLNMSGTNGKVALANITASLACGATATPCVLPHVNIVDLVSYGTANNAEGGAAVPALTTTTGAVRKSLGCQDTDNNLSDFDVVTAPVPRNAASPIHLCSGPVTPNLTINDVSLSEGNSGTTTFTFTVSLSAPAPVGGVTFDITTADNTATQPSDYAQNTLTAQTIPAGSSTYTFDVLVNGDTTDEPNETFFVNVTTVVGATVTDGQGLGTITNDDSLLPDLTINDVSANEGDSGATTFTFTVSLSFAAPSGGVTFDIATANGTATEPTDYTANSMPAQSIAAGISTYTFDVLVNGDGAAEPNETFFVNVTSVTGATVIDGQGLGTVLNDDWTRIHDIQGSGHSSPLVGLTVTTRGIVTAMLSGSFFIQEPDATVDADPNTSEGLLVYKAPTGLAVGDLVSATGVVQEYKPAAEPSPLFPTTTELGTVTFTKLGSGNPAPAPIVLTPADTDPAGDFFNLEKYAAMRVTAASFTVMAPTGGYYTDTTGLGTTNGFFWASITGVSRPFHEPGVHVMSPLDPLGIPPGPCVAPCVPANVPRWDGNPELFDVGSNKQTGSAAFDARAGDVLQMTGIITFSTSAGFRCWQFYPDPGGLSVVSRPDATPAAAPASDEITVASFNMLHFFAPPFEQRKNKALAVIRDYLHTPDILAVEEVDTIATLQLLRDHINANDPSAPAYEAYLIEGNDVGGIDVGFLIKTKVVDGLHPRVQQLSVVQENATEVFYNPDGSPYGLLNDRPPLRLTAVVYDADGASFPITVIAVHQRSLGGVDDMAAGSNGWATLGARVRGKRAAQAESLATLVNARQIADPTEHIVILGDYNAYEFSDGYGDIINTTTGALPTTPADEVVVASAYQYTTPPLQRLAPADPAQNYSFTFDGSAQNLDHVVVNGALQTATTVRLDHARVNADFPQTDCNDPNSPRRTSDHDPVVAYFKVGAFATDDMSVAFTSAPTQALAGSTFDYVIAVTSNGPGTAPDAQLVDTLAIETGFIALASPAGWSCTTPAVGATGQVSCTNPSMAPGTVSFTVTVQVAPGTTPGTLFTNSATVSSDATDPNPANNTASASTTVILAPAITSANRAAFNILTPGTFTVTATGFPVPTITRAGGLPNGLTFVDNGNGTATLSGTPQKGGAGTFPLTITANNGVGAPVSQSFTITVAGSRTTTSVSSSRNPVPAGQVVRFTATVSFYTKLLGTPTGTIVFRVDGVQVGAPVPKGSGPVVSGPWSSTVTGPHTVTATYVGDGSFAPSTVTLTETVQ